MTATLSCHYCGAELSQFDVYADPDGFTCPSCGAGGT